MEGPATWLKQHLWAAFVAHQVGLLVIAIVFLSSVRRITGRTIHLGKDPIGLMFSVTFVLLSGIERSRRLCR